MILRLFPAVCLLKVAACGIFAQQASFYKEHISFKIDEGYFHVNGEYFLKSEKNASEQIRLFYPFPTDSIYASVDSLLIYDVNNAKEITHIERMKSGIIFNLPMDTGARVIISYTQKLLSNQARYILTTTQYWGMPLEEVTYELITPADMKILSFSYPPDKKQEIGDAIIYFWRKENFMPLQDMIFIFELPETFE